MTRKIHPLDSVRLTLNCDAGTLSLDVNGVDQGVVFSNVPPDVHPAVCFYGIAKSVRLVELKRIYGDSDSDVSDSEGESDAESMPTPTEGAGETVPSLQRVLRPPTTMALAGEDLAETSEVGASAGPNQASRARSGPCIDTDKVSRGSPDEANTRRATRREEEAVASTIRAAAADAPSSGLLASLANFAQWYVPRGQDGDQHGTTSQRSDLDEVDGHMMPQTPDSGTLAQRVRRVLPLFPGKTKFALGALIDNRTVGQVRWSAISRKICEKRSLPVFVLGTAVRVTYAHLPFCCHVRPFQLWLRPVMAAGVLQGGRSRQMPSPDGMLGESSNGYLLTSSRFFTFNSMVSNTSSFCSATFGLPTARKS